jgi:AcrR family transcriptional regulator
MTDANSDKKQLILDTAEALFAQFGFDSTSTRDIADKAGVNVAMISYYFGSKQNLMQAIIERHGENIYATLQNAYDTQLAPEPRMRSLIRAYIQYCLKHPDPIVIAHREMGVNLRPLLHDQITCVFKQVKDIIESIIIEGQQTGIFRQLDLPFFLFMMGNMVDGMIHELNAMRYVNLDWETLGVPSMSDPNFPDKFHDFFEDVVMTYLLTRPE